jgi:type VI protein secretion system component Hcp
MWCLIDGHAETKFVWKLTNGQLESVSLNAGATELVETMAMNFEKLEFDATAGGTTTMTSLNGQVPIV